ncbi:MAG: glycoside hydrolase family protein, partial [Planctomycetota bacterium]
EYPFPFWNPADRRFYVYYLGRQKRVPKQTGLLVGDGDFGRWTRVRTTPVIAADTEHERKGSSHPSVAVVGDTIHIIYTGESTKPPVICHATAPTSDPATVTKDPANPIFEGTGQTWDSSGVREAEIFKGPRYFHILYGGSDGKVWRIVSISCTAGPTARSGGSAMFAPATSATSSPTHTIPSSRHRSTAARGIVTVSSRLKSSRPGISTTCSMQARKTKNGKQALPKRASHKALVIANERVEVVEWTLSKGVLYGHSERPGVLYGNHIYIVKRK